MDRKEANVIDVTLDATREKRAGVPEVIYCASKDSAQISQVLKLHANCPEKDTPLILSRLDEEKYADIRHENGSLRYFTKARVGIVGENRAQFSDMCRIVIVTAGASDVSVAEEAAVTLEALGHNVDRVYDVGVAGIHRVLSKQEILREATVCIVVAGMEGALPSVVAGLTPAPVIAVPTSVGYGASFQGLSALLGMLNSCSPGLSVVNIDNGIGAALVAHKIAGQLRKLLTAMSETRDFEL